MILLVKVNGSPTNVNIIQAYAPTADKSEEELEKVYKELQIATKSTKKNEINIYICEIGTWGHVQFCQETILMYLSGCATDGIWDRWI